MTVIAAAPPARLLGPRLVRVLVVVLAAIAALVAAEWLVDRWSAEPPPPTAAPRVLPPRPEGLPDSYAEAVAALNASVSDTAARASADPQWLPHDQAAVQLLERARLTGSFDDYARAQAMLDRAFQLAGPGIGPHATRAALAFAMHRLGEAERQLDMIDRYAVPPLRAERAEHRGMRGDIAFYRGDFAGALAHYDAADEIDDGASDFRRGVYFMMTGSPDRAEAAFNDFESAQPNPGRRLRAFMDLQRGILDLDRGRLDQALAHFRAADAHLPGYWLVEEHIAEVTALSGDLAAAEALYRGIVGRTGHPEFMDALAGVLEERGNRAEARSWYARAGAAWRTRLAQFPEAAAGHAIDHCVAIGDWRCALNLAVRNHTARPYPGAKIPLAHALLHNGRTAEARAVIEAALATPWRSAELHYTAAEIFRAAGDGAAADAQRRLALALNPRADAYFAE